jgi:Spy/CpxP family protein refolding chaperone
MKRFLKIISAAVLVVTIAQVSAFADPVKGQKLYLKKIKKSCVATGAVMAAKHTQNEWRQIKESGKFEEEMKALCPDLKGVSEKYQEDIFDFFHKYASDSGNVPSC